MTKTAYIRRDGEAAYEIEADRHGNYTITQGGKVVKRVTALVHYAGRPRWGSRQLEQNAIADARAAIDAMTPSP